MTRVLALGGCGGIGRYAVRTLLGDDRIDEIVVGDLDGERAARWAAECGPRVRAQRIDVTDEDALRAALSEVDVCMNCVGPYFRFGVPILWASLEAGRHYVDVCDDWAPTLEMFELDGLAREKGVTAVVGMGISPGVSNLLATLALGELDEAEEVVTGWELDAARPAEIRREPSAATVHGIEQLTGTIRVRREGRFTDEKPLRKIWVDYPGLGPRRAWTIGHPEPVTLPRTFGAIRESVNVMLSTPGTILATRALASLVNVGILSRQRAARVAEILEGPGGEAPTVREVVDRAARSGRLNLPPIFAYARGTRAGRPGAVGATLLAAPAGGMGGATGVPLGVGVRMLVAGQIARKGVLAPEACIDPAAFFDALAPLCTPPCADGQSLVLVTRSWEPGTLLDGYRAALTG